LVDPVSTVVDRVVGRREIESLPLNGRNSLEMVRLIVKGMTVRKIAATVFITEGTVKVHANNLLGKLGMRDRTKAATAALQPGIVRLD
jgi:DNA-binding NarL/FixJ family response regulator